MPEVVLAGCTPEPLMSYLKALGVFRLVAEQADPAAKLSWGGGVAQLHSKLDREGLEKFFLEQYEPTPVVGPWGARSGFYPGSSESSAREALDRIVSAAESNSRLALFREVILAIRELLTRQGYSEKVKDDDKLNLMQLCRNNLPDRLLPWLDAVFILTEDSRKFPPLLGTGGNEGSGSYVSTFAQAVVSLLIDQDNNDGAAGALFAEFKPLVGGLAVGHFSPGAIGGANSSQGFGGGGGVNSWDYLLAIEGCLVFAGSAARRYGADSIGRAGYPFCVEAVAVGYASESDKEAGQSTRAELWLPLWSSPVSLVELSQLFAEGRAQLGRRQARNAIDFALAVATLGVSTGVDSFIRFAFVMRNGLSYFAAPLGYIPVLARPNAQLICDPALAEWVQRLRDACRDKDRTPARYQTALRQIDQATFEFATRSEHGNDTKYLVGVLRALGQAEQVLATGLAFAKDKYIRPLQGLNPQWLIDAAPKGEAGREFRLAASLASILGVLRSAVGPLRTHLERVEQKTDWTKWSPGSTSAVWSNASLTDNLSAVLVRRLIESEKATEQGCSLHARVFAPLADVVAFINRQTRDELLNDLLWALVGLQWNSPAFQGRSFQKERSQAFRVSQAVAVPASFSLIRLTLAPLRMTTENVQGNQGPESRWKVVGRSEKGEPATLITIPSAGPFHQLKRGNLSEAENLAARRLWADRLVPFGWANRRRRQSKYELAGNLDTSRLLAACLFPLSSNSMTRLARQVLNPPVPVR